MDRLKIILLISSITSSLLPLTIGIKRRYSILWYYSFLCFIADILIVVLKRVAHLDYHWVGNVFTPLQFILISWYYKDKIFRNSSFFYFHIGLFLLLYEYLMIDNTLLDLNGKGSAIYFLVFIVYSIAGFYKIQKEQTIVRLESSSFFWVNATFLIYSSGCFLLFLFKDYLRDNHNELFITLWGVFLLSLNIIKNIILAIALAANKDNDE